MKITRQLLKRIIKEQMEGEVKYPPGSVGERYGSIDVRQTLSNLGSEKLSNLLGQNLTDYVGAISSNVNPRHHQRLKIATRAKDYKMLADVLADIVLRSTGRQGDEASFKSIDQLIDQLKNLADTEENSNGW